MSLADWRTMRNSMTRPKPGVAEVDSPDDERLIERVCAVDVAKASGKVCTRVPHDTITGRRVTKVWDVSATTTAIMALADDLVTARIERVVVESTSDYWRPSSCICSKPPGSQRGWSTRVT